LRYSDEAVTRAIHLSASHPFLLQNLCNRVFDLSAREQRRSVTADTVGRAADELIEDNEHFAALWGYCASDRRRLILALCYLDGLAGDGLRLGQLSDQLAERGVEVSDETLQQDLEHLRELELLELAGEGEYGRYGLAIPLMGLWIGKQQDIDGLIRRARVETEEAHE
jgi:type I restriction enzyme M protein